ncbi:hypothetical protein [Geodermatophilus sabuli]|uniref:hypothetical protein n=1 Tax=Geodermatophilus sabuli TaxID=1564158 RepID=UPI000BE36864|nr:hypothetical protein [Geodermatophilus sabuli]MBB3083433.1 hypothetical protein [Geodermatophilus sabuli]
MAQQSGQVVGIGPEALTVGLDDVEHTTSQLEEATQTLRAFLQHVQQAAEARQQWAAEKAAEIAQDYLDEG